LLPIGVAAQVAGDPPILAPGLHDLTLPRAGGPVIHYTISIPRNYSPSTPVPLILALHFGVRGGDTAGAGAAVVESLIGPALADLGAIIVAPDSVRGDWSSLENETAVNALVDVVLAHYSIDRKKVAVTGFSMGGAGSWQFAEKFPERFSVAIPVAGRPPASASGWRLPVLAIHSRDDQVAPFGPTEARIAELQRAGVNAKLIALTGITHYEPPPLQGCIAAIGSMVAGGLEIGLTGICALGPQDLDRPEPCLAHRNSDGSQVPPPETSDVGHL
jgi:poly(3-hydroxybutyrate) depolymerase